MQVEQVRFHARRIIQSHVRRDRKTSLWQRLRPAFEGFDGGLMLAVALLVSGGLLVMYSVGYDNGTRFPDQARNMLIALGMMFLVAQIPLQPPVAAGGAALRPGVTLLVAVALFGITKKGATRWINVGVVIQPRRDREDRHAADVVLVVPEARAPCVRSTSRSPG